MISVGICLAVLEGLLRGDGFKTRCSVHIAVIQVLMDQPDRHRALAYRGDAPLDRASAHITRREHAGQARLQGVRLAREAPPGISIEHGVVQRSPVRTKPRASSSTAPLSQPVLASAPMKTKRARTPSVLHLPERLSSTTILSRRSSPRSSRITARPRYESPTASVHHTRQGRQAILPRWVCLVMISRMVEGPLHQAQIPLP